MEALFILLILEIALFFIAFAMSNKDIMAPSVMMCIMFLISTMFALLNAKTWNVKYDLESVMILSSGIFVFIVSEVIYRYFLCGQLRGERRISEYRDVKYIYIKPFVLYMIILFNICVCLMYFRQIMSIVGGNLTNISSYFLAYRRIGISNLKYQDGEMVSGIITQLMKVVIATGYVSSYVFLNNWISDIKKTKIQILHLIIIIISIIPSIMTGGRTGILRMISAMLIYYYILWHQKNGWTRNLSWKYIRIGIIGILIGCPAFYYSLVLLGRTTNRQFVDYISDYVGSSIVLFDEYVKNPIECKSFGEETLFGIKKLLNFLGLGDASQAYNLEFRNVGIGSSNVYTFFRRPLHDFGLFGMYIFVSLIAFFFAWIYFKHIKYKKKERSELWVLAYGYLYYWIVSSSIVQYSVNYISVGAGLIIMIIIILFRFMTKERIQI